jgi:hypothetical protein
MPKVAPKGGLGWQKIVTPGTPGVTLTLAA